MGCAREGTAVSLNGKKVKHDKFGEGVITQQDAACVSVKFVTETEPKRFIYPSCFKTFLKLPDEEAAASVNAYLTASVLNIRMGDTYTALKLTMN